MNLSEFKAFTLPGGERHFIYDDVPTVSVTELRGVIRDSDDIMDLVIATDYIRSKQWQITELILPYVPYARQDRATTPESPFSLRPFAKLINSLGYSRVDVYEPHSDVAPALINNCYVTTMDAAANQFLATIDDPILVAPDASASKRVQRLTDARYVQAFKKRDPATGHLVFGALYGDVDDRNTVIVDDLCDGGATFIPIAKELISRGAASVSLFVAHGIFSKGLADMLDAGITRFGTTDSFCQRNDTDLVKIYRSI